VILHEAAQALQMVPRHTLGGLGFYREVHVAQDEVHLDAAGQASVREARIDLMVADERRQLVKDPVLERLSV